MLRRLGPSNWRDEEHRGVTFLSPYFVSGARWALWYEGAYVFLDETEVQEQLSAFPTES